MEQPAQRSAGSRGRNLTPEDKAALVAINREIAQSAARKDISAATSAFQKACKAGWANAHTFSAMINAQVRCGDVLGAEDTFSKLKASGNKLDVVSCTTMIKGYCSLGDIGAAMNLLLSMKERNMVLNIRTVNTMIRGCLSTGHYRIGHNLFTCMQNVFNVTPDASSWEYEGI